MPTKAQQALIYRKVPAYLRKLREEAGLSQRALGERLKKNQGWVFKCEAAVRRIDIAEFIEWVLACEVDAADAFQDLLKMRGG